MKTLMNGIFGANPVFRLLLGLAPVIAIANLAWNGLYLGLTTLVILLAAVIVGLFLESFVPQGARPALHLALLVLFTTIAHRFLSINYPVIVVNLGIFIPLIVVNGFVLHRIDKAGSASETILGTVGMGLGFTLALVIVGVVREFLALGSVFGHALLSANLQPFALAATVPGGLIIFGLLLGLVNALSGKGGELSE